MILEEKMYLAPLRAVLKQMTQRKEDPDIIAKFKLFVETKLQAKGLAILDKVNKAGQPNNHYLYFSFKKNPL